MVNAQRFMTMDYAYTEDSKLTELLERMQTQARGNGLGMLRIYMASVSLVEALFGMGFSLFLLLNYFAMSGGLAVSQFWIIALCVMFALGLLANFIMLSVSAKKVSQIFIDNEKCNASAGYYLTYIKADEAAKDARLYNQKNMIVKIFEESFPLRTWLNFFTFEGHTQAILSALLAFVGGAFFILSGVGALGGAPVGGIVQSVGAVTTLASAFAAVVNVAGTLYMNAPFLKPLRDFMQMPDLLVKGDKPIPFILNKAAGKNCIVNADDIEIEFANVSFKYPASETYALRNLNLKLHSGKRLAVVGLNGSGKTTMIKLLCRLYDPTEGEIRLNGVNIKELSKEEYTKLFTVVFQDFKLFPLWLGQNVSVSGEPDAARVAECLDKAGFSERLQKLPHGIDTILFTQYDEDGVQVSGGEAQKIALARALYKTAPIVVLDEPTAALDPIAEAEVYSTFDRTIEGRTCVFVSHRLSSCKFCDDIAVFDGGTLTQRGDHETLLSDTTGRYHELWNAQASHYTE
jgi:ATP-binding cassette subfamily B protein